MIKILAIRVTQRKICVLNSVGTPGEVNIGTFDCTKNIGQNHLFTLVSVSVGQLTCFKCY